MDINRECKKEIHLQRTNDFGVTWYIRCGRLFNKSVDKRITENDREIRGIKLHVLSQYEIDKIRIKAYKYAI